MSKVQTVELSVVIIVLNEEYNLPRCLASLPSGCEIVVVDSGSQDRTRSIAESYGARVFERAFTDFAEQKNFGLVQASRRWVLSLDADEVLSPKLREWVSEQSRQAAGNQAYRLRRQLVFMGRKMRWGKTQDAPIRFFPREMASFKGGIHESLDVRREQLLVAPEGVLWHYSYQDLSDYFVRFNRYTSAVAARHVEEGLSRPSLLAHLIRPWWEFFERYVLRLGFLDGYQGYTYALLSSLYAYTKYAKIYETNSQLADQPVTIK